MRLCRAAATFGLAMLLLAASKVSAQEIAVAESLRLQLEAISADRQVADIDPAAASSLLQMYERLGFSPVWSNSSRIQSLIDAIKASAEDGLDPDDYRLARIADAYAQLESGSTIPPVDRAALDLLLSDSLVRLFCHQRLGKIDPQTLQPRWSLPGQLDTRDAVAEILRLIRSASIAATLRNSLPRNDGYRRLQKALADYREIADSGGWPRVADGPTLHPGETDGRLGALASRLAISGDLAMPGAYSDSAGYDETLQTAVRRFQARHGLEVDGLVGADTLRALNVSVEMRVDQIRINLERARWILDALQDKSVLVNVAGFEAFLVANREVLWSARVQVGEPDKQTPILDSIIQRLVFNPTWTVPRSIATEEMLPVIRNDSSYLRRGNYDLYDSDRALVNPDTVDWSTVTKGNFPYTIVQRPGSFNALGRVKFEFANEHSVYLHDTPNKAMFDKARRACTHGCIRLESPLDLATMLLEDSGWQREAIDSLIAETATRTIPLDKPVPILIQYWTADVDADGIVHFYDDIYDRDRQLFEALNLRYSILRRAQ